MVILWLLTLMLALLLLLLGWHISNLGIVPEAYQLFPEFRISKVSADTVTLPLPSSRRQFADTRREGDFVLLYEQGWGVLGDVIKEDDEQVIRTFQHVSGALPMTGDAARLDSFYFRRDPQKDLGLDFETIKLSNSIGDHTAWWLAREGQTAIVLLHGRRRGELIETMRAMSCFKALDIAMLAVSYRNHRGSPMSPDGFYHYGQTEWQDAMLAIEFLQERGYSQIIIYGISTGCAVAHELYTVLERQGRDHLIKAFIFDSPLLDAAEIMHRGGRNAKVPALLTVLALKIARWRSGIDWQRLDHRRCAETMNKPTLLIAGTQDSTVPIELCDDYAALAPNAVDYWRVPGAEHVEIWNLHRQAYQERLQNFVNKILSD